MNSKDLRYKENFIYNGNFLDDLDGWTLGADGRVIKSDDRWDGTLTANMHAFDGGTASQTIELAAHPRPQDGKAVYELEFYYQAYGNTNAKLRIVTSSGANEELDLVTSLNPQSERPIDPTIPRDINLTRYVLLLELIEPEDENVTVMFISQKDVGPIDHGIQVTFVRVELLLEDLRLESLIIDDEPQPLDEALRLCFGASNDKTHQLILVPADGSIWLGTKAGLWLEEDATGLLSASPPWEQEQPIEDEWGISCGVPIDNNQEYSHSVQVRSQYTAAPYDLTARSGHFRVELAVLQDVAYYPVVTLGQSVTVRVQVQSHYTQTALPDREVTWAVTSKSATAPLMLLTQRSDGNGESSYTYTPSSEGDYQITASVDSHYKKDEAERVFEVRALADDPWKQATFALENTTLPFIWGAESAYPCRGRSHEATITFPTGHALAGTDLMLKWESTAGDTPGELGVTFSPPLEEMTAIDADRLTWSMDYVDNKDADFNLIVRCSKLLEDSPRQKMELAHNSLDIVDHRQAPKFPYVSSDVSLRLEVQVSSQVEGVQVGRGINVEWRLDDGPPDSTGTGEGGWSGHVFDLDEAGTFQIVASVASRYEGSCVEHPFDIEVFAENPWRSLVNVTLDDKLTESGRLPFFLGADDSVLRVGPAGDTFLHEEIWLELEEGTEPPIAADPAFGVRREMTEDGLAWNIRPSATTSTQFPLNISHEDLGPFEFEGLLLSGTLEGEGDLTFDGKQIRPADKIYPCIGGTHTLRFGPKAGSPLVLLDVAAQWASETLGIELDPAPGEPIPLPSDGVEWTLTAPQAGTAQESGLSLKFPQIEFTYPPVSLNLGHHRFEIRGEGPEADLWVGESAILKVSVISHYTRAPLSNVEVMFSQGSYSQTRTTGSNGKAEFAFEATEPGEARITAQVPSGYYDPDDFPFHEFVIHVYGP